MDDDRGPKRSNREVVCAQSYRQRAEQEAEQPGSPGSADPPRGDRQGEAAEATRRQRRRQQRRDISADRHEAGDANVEEAGLPPLHVEAETDDGVGQRDRHEECAIAEEIESHLRSPEQAARPQQQDGDQEREGDGGAPFRADQSHGQRFG